MGKSEETPKKVASAKKSESYSNRGKIIRLKNHCVRIRRKAIKYMKQVQSDKPPKKFHPVYVDLIAEEALKKLDPGLYNKMETKYPVDLRLCVHHTPKEPRGFHHRRSK